MMASSSSTMNSPCAACKCLRRKCVPGCIFAPYFPQDQPAKFVHVHHVFGASNVSKILSDLHPSHRAEAANSLAYEANARLRDPIYGCVGYIYILQHHLRNLQRELHNAKMELSSYVGPSAMSVPLLNPADNAMNPNHSFHEQEQLPCWTRSPLMGDGELALVQGQQYHQQQIWETQGLAFAATTPREPQEMIQGDDYDQQRRQQFRGIDDSHGSRFGGFNQLGGVVTAVEPAEPSHARLSRHSTMLTNVGSLDHARPSTGLALTGQSTLSAHAGPSTGLALGQNFDTTFPHLQPHAHQQEQQQQHQAHGQHHQRCSRFGHEEGVGSSWDGAGRGPSS